MCQSARAVPLCLGPASCCTHLVDVQYGLLIMPVCSAELTGASLRDAKLTDANFTGAKLDKAILQVLSHDRDAYLSMWLSLCLTSTIQAVADGVVPTMY